MRRRKGKGKPRGPRKPKAEQPPEQLASKKPPRLSAREGVASRPTTRGAYDVSLSAFREKVYFRGVFVAVDNAGQPLIDAETGHVKELSRATGVALEDVDAVAECWREAAKADVGALLPGLMADAAARAEAAGLEVQAAAGASRPEVLGEDVRAVPLGKGVFLGFQALLHPDGSLGGRLFCQATHGKRNRWIPVTEEALATLIVKASEWLDVLAAERARLQKLLESALPGGAENFAGTGPEGGDLVH